MSSFLAVGLQHLSSFAAVCPELRLVSIHQPLWVGHRLVIVFKIFKVEKGLGSGEDSLKSVGSIQLILCLSEWQDGVGGQTNVATKLRKKEKIGYFFLDIIHLYKATHIKRCQFLQQVRASPPLAAYLHIYVLICLGIPNHAFWGFLTFCVVGQDNGHFTFSSFFSWSASVAVE